MTPALDLDEIEARLKFHGRYGAETQDECVIRKNKEREQAADTIAALTKRVRELESALSEQRERDAKIAEAAQSNHDYDNAMTCRYIASAIRAGKEQG